MQSLLLIYVIQERVADIMSLGLGFYYVSTISPYRLFVHSYS